MKRQIDPNLSSNESEDILLGNEKNKNNSLFQLTEKDTESSIDEVLFGTDNTKKKCETTEQLPEVQPTQRHHSSSHHSHSSSHHHSSHHRHHSSSSHSSSGRHSSHSHSSSNHHSSSKRRKKKKSKIPKWLKIFLIIIMIIALLAATLVIGFTVVKNRGRSDLTSIIDSDTNRTEIIQYNGHSYEYNKDIVTIAFMGIDERDLEYRDEYINNLGCADADMVAAINTKDGTMKVISIPRDTVVDIDIYSSSGVFLKTQSVQLTIAYAYGDGAEQSCTNVTKAMSRILYNVPIDKYFALNLSGIKPLNDAIGGVTLTAQYSVPSAGINKGEKVTLKGDMAEAYIRTRDMDHATAALERGERQLQYVKAFTDQLIPVVKKDFSVVSDLYNIAKDYCQTNISLNNATYLASTILSKGVTSFETYKLEGDVELRAVNPNNPDYVNAYFTPDEDQLMQTVLDVFYVQID